MMHAESDFQVGVVRFLRMAGHFVFAVPNTRYNAKEGHLFKIMGQMPGVSDLIVLLPNKVYFIEIKNPNGKGRQSPAQRDFEDAVRAYGHEYLLWDKWAQVEQFINAHRADVGNFMGVGGTN